MDHERYRSAIELIAGLAPDARSFRTDRSGRRRENMSQADLAWAILADLVDPDVVGQDRRNELR